MLPARPYPRASTRPETTCIDHAMKTKYVERSEADFDSVEWVGIDELDKLKTDKCERKRGRALAALKTTGPIDV
ncbi:hypothetical protein IE4771_PE00094 (plasmid) [Rhizobium etli bv. mimosae str. IE4771]|uniref:Uncharacterized protein n=2 Tax=Rhizobium etli TaxID=29449 RepID=A0A060IH89_RHIET|nr:hypothetical protein IE4771_PE00094 [Rhizobium sp. IE4771]